MRLLICPPESKELVANGKSIYGVDHTKTLSEVRSTKGKGEISFTGSKKIGTIEGEFEKIFGLYVQICYITKEGKRHYTTNAEDGLTLGALNHKTSADISTTSKEGIKIKGNMLVRDVEKSFLDTYGVTVQIKDKKAQKLMDNNSTLGEAARNQ